MGNTMSKEMEDFLRQDRLFITEERKETIEMSRRQAIFVKEEEKLVHGQLVAVKVYSQIDPTPSYSHDKYMAEICGATPERIATIKAELEEYKESKLTAVDADVEYGFESTENDGFLDTVAENAEGELAIYREETEESYESLDIMLEGLGIE